MKVSRYMQQPKMMEVPRVATGGIHKRDALISYSGKGKGGNDRRKHRRNLSSDTQSPLKLKLSSVPSLLV